MASQTVKMLHKKCCTTTLFQLCYSVRHEKISYGARSVNFLLQTKMFRNVGRLGTRPITRRFVSSKTVESANTKLNSSKPALSNLGEEEWKAIEEQKMLDLTRDQITSILCDLSKHVPRGRLPVCQTHPSITLASYSKSLSSDELLGSFDASSFRSDHKQLTALGNLIFQLDSDNKYLSYFIWEIGVLKQEKNALYSLALLMMQSDCNFFNLDLCADLFSEADRLGHQYATVLLSLEYDVLYDNLFVV